MPINHLRSQVTGGGARKSWMGAGQVGVCGMIQDVTEVTRLQNMRGGTTKSEDNQERGLDNYWK